MGVHFVKSCRPLQFWVDRIAGMGREPTMAVLSLTNATLSIFLVWVSLVAIPLSAPRTLLPLVKL